ncbi:ribonuclease H-like domain-containing protein, partial [Tanacetum coccineum]
MSSCLIVLAGSLLCHFLLVLPYVDPSSVLISAAFAWQLNWLLFACCLSWLSLRDYLVLIGSVLSAFMWFVLIMPEDIVCNAIMNIIILIYNQFDVKIHVCDLCSGLGILQQSVCSLSEMKHRLLLNVARCLMFQGGIHLKCWSDYGLAALSLSNRLHYSVLNGMSPYVLVQNNKPNLSFVRYFGCQCVLIILNNSDKLTSRYDKYGLIEFSCDKKAYKLLCLYNKIVVFSIGVSLYQTVLFLKMRIKSVNDGVFKREAHILTFLDIQISIRPNDVERASSVVDGRVPSHEVDSATQLVEYSSSEGNVFDPNTCLNTALNLRRNLNSDVVQFCVRKSSRPSKSLTRMNGLVT